MDECIDDLQCDSLLGLKKCLDDPKTNKKRCMVGAKLGEACSNTTYREEYVYLYLVPSFIHRF